MKNELKYTYNCLYNFTVYFSIQYYTDSNRKNVFKKCNSELMLGCRYFQHIFTKWVSNVMCVSINEQLTSFQNCFGVLSRLCQERAKMRFLVSNVSVGNITLCRRPRHPRYSDWAGMLYTVATNICGASVWNLFPITFLSPRIFRCFLNFCKILYTPAVAHYDFQLKQLCEFLSFRSGEVDVSSLLGYCALVLGNWCLTFRDSVVVPKRRELTTQWRGPMSQEDRDLKLRC